MKSRILVSLAVAGALVTAGCSDSNAPSGNQNGSDQVVVGFSVYDMQYEFFQKMEQGTRAAATAKGWEFKLHDEKSDENEMVTGAQALIDQGVDVLIISPFKPSALGPIIAKAKAKGVPVIVDDIGGGGAPYDAIVISDNAGGGKLAAEFMAKQIAANGKTGKNVASITCEPSAVYAARRNAGFKAEIEKQGFKVVAELSGNSKAEEGYKVMKDILAKNPDVAGVFSCNDPMGVAAANAVKDAGKDPVKDIVTVGFNADPEAITAIKGDGLAATVAQDPAAMGALTVKLADQALAKTALTFDNAAEREVYNPVQLISKENVDTVK
ncbi:substrate-binding domain-containing protein [Catellatospora chokoriensis]|uniref:D-ribose ABC transporter substrate-binding protein n=1 Tax=Catellatospora chokoriensis TaxID=310353 RepID=A0A8J3NTV5_9ACTN|nr:substrate-binding domain-containing protein [Catellatospora chokoriensis]GIF92158.1 D-ribose ABC transporter substrate-binding protein [Catellatospora chokoriensis]